MLCDVLMKFNAPLVVLKSIIRLELARWRAHKTTIKKKRTHSLLELVTSFSKGAYKQNARAFRHHVVAFWRCCTASPHWWFLACTIKDEFELVIIQQLSKATKIAPTVQMIAEGVSTNFYNCTHWSHALSTAVTLSHHDYTILAHRVIMLTFWNSGGIVTTANGPTAG